MQPAQTTSVVDPRWQWTIKCLLAGWLLVGIWTAIRLLRDVWQTEVLRSRSTPADHATIRISHDVAEKLNVTKPAVLMTPLLNSPCLVGHWRPTVLLPEDTEPDSLREVFLHELAHLRRRDWLWSIIGRAVKCLLCCQPLVGILVRKDAIAAEEVCDDFVLQHGGCRDGYLQQLINIAEQSLPALSLIHI